MGLGDPILTQGQKLWYSTICVLHFEDPFSPTLFKFSSEFGFKGQFHEIFASGFLYESSSSKTLKIILGSFQFFSKLGDIHKSRCTTGVNNTGGKFATGINDTGRPPLLLVSFIYVLALPPKCGQTKDFT
jgi:hypothetical protein